MRVLTLPDELLFQEVQQRPCFNDWMHAMLGNNIELDRLRALEEEIRRFRQAVQGHLDRWKIRWNIDISLEEELAATAKADAPFSEVKELIATLSQQINRDLDSIFRQVEEHLAESKHRTVSLTEENAHVLEQVRRLEQQLKQAEDRAAQLPPPAPPPPDPNPDLLLERDSLKQSYTDLQQKLQEFQAHALETSQENSKDLKYWSLRALDSEAKMELKEARMRSLEEGNNQVLGLTQDLEKTHAAYMEERKRAHDEAVARKNEIEQLERDRKFFEDEMEVRNLTVQRQRLQIETLIGDLNENKAQLDLANRELAKKNDIDPRVPFMIAFIHSLDFATQYKFKAMYLTKFPQDKFEYHM